MKYAVCILAHKEPELLSRLVKKTVSDNTKIYIHLDKKSDINDFLHIKDAKFIDSRVKVYWGGRSVVRAMYNLICEVVKDNECDYLLFISGQDYPLVLPSEYDNIIDKSKNYIEYSALPRNDWFRGGLERIHYYYFFENKKKPIAKILVKIQRKIGIRRKPGMKVYAGSQWININIETAKTIVSNWEKYYRYFKYTGIPDEIFFQTLVMNSEHAENVVNNNLRYIIFKDNNPNPIILNDEHYNSIINSNALFFRKTAENALLDKIDSYHENKYGVK